jgi:hypothetical protein
MLKEGKPGESYSEIKPLLETFDLLLFRGADAFSGLIAKVEKIEDGQQAPDFTHAGCVIRGCDLLPIQRVEEQNWLKADDVYVFESTMSGTLADGPADVTNHARFGVQLRQLDKVVAAYDEPAISRMAWAPLRKDIRERITANDGCKKARAEYEKYKGLRYDASAVDLAAAAGIPCARCIRDCYTFQRIRDCLYCCCRKRDDFSPQSHKRDDVPSNWQFCSELVANIYKDLGIIPESVVTANVMPVDFLCDPEHPEKTFDADKQVPPVCVPFVRFHK